jgi:superfamily II DNA/RNA helicase
MENYLHRVGRTARAGKKGLVINLVTERDRQLMAQLDGNKPPSADRKDKAKSRAPSNQRFKQSRPKGH